ncbi:MAG: Crp/Fnr family transcriptional regulator, partial [Bacteroidota bacterium]
MLKRQLVKENIAKYIDLTEEEFDYFYGLLEIRNYGKKEVVHAIGQVCQWAYLILEGSIRYFHLVDGEEKSGQFFFEGAWYSDYDSFLFGTPSLQTIQAVEKTQAARLSKESLHQLYQQVPKFEKFGRLMAENAFIGIRKRTESLTHLSATERYLDLMRNRPKVIQRIPQKYIASYLDIQPQSLSRIKK